MVVGVWGGVPGPGGMGTVVDVLELVTGNGWGAASFVLAVAVWRQSRPQRAWVGIRRGGTVIVLVEGSEGRSRGRSGRWRRSVAVRAGSGECAVRSGGFARCAGGDEPV
ncbi:hypothetical protein [Streptomyces sp. NPDC058457]|uniref:effector-associated constant component EACC1 n=1 Tax=Streptomyces sp. NPDC058457 TaxID=3346507 RepID=UPI00365A800F